MRPFLSLLFKIVQERSDVVVSVPVINGRFKDGIDSEVARFCNSGLNSDLRNNIRIFQLSNFDGPEMERWLNMRTSWPDFFTKSWACEPITCFSGRTYPSAPRQSLCIIDIMIAGSFAADLAEEKKLKMLILEPGGASHLMAAIVPPESGGKDNFKQDIEELAKRKNISIEEASAEVLTGFSDQVKKIAGLPPAYDYEFSSEYTVEGATDYIIDIVDAAFKLHRECDGTIFASSPIIEEEAITAFRRWWCDSLGKTCYAVGPLVIPDPVASDHDEFPEVRSFLDRICESHGKRSLLYMSFGTSIFPSGETPWQLINIILDMGIPLILSMPYDNSYESQLPNDLRNKLQSSKLTLCAKWLPQPMILNHPATAAFLTHGGQGSLTEALVAGVLLIVWPLQADQPHNCMNLTLNLGVAYQLCEVRIKHGLLPLYRGIQPTGTKEAIDREFRRVLKDAFGTDGDAKRKILEGLSRKLRETWEENGEALGDMRRMLRENLS